MSTTYDVIPADYVWIDDGAATAGDRYAFEEALQSDRAVKGLWRITVLVEDGDDILPVLVPAR